MNRAGIGSLMGESGRTMSDDVKLAKMDRRIADLGASQGMAPATQRMMLIKKTAADMGKIISEEDAKLFGAGEISFQDAMTTENSSRPRTATSSRSHTTICCGHD